MTYTREEVEHVYTTARRLRARLGSLAKVAGARCEPRELAELIAGEAISALGAAACVVTTYAASGALATYAFCNPLGLKTAEIERASLAGAREIAAAGGTRAMAPGGEGQGRTGVQGSYWSCLGVPLVAPSGETLGVACVLGDAGRHFNEEDGWWLEAASRPLADALHAHTLEERWREREIPPVRASGAEALTGASSSNAGRALSVLVVDDDRAVNDLLCEFVKMEGHHVEAAFDGLDAARRFNAAVHDLVITDVAMPLMNGWELIAELRVRAPGLPVILITGYGSGNWNEGFLQRHGVRALLHKPLDAVLFARTLRELSEEMGLRAA